jgi:hypothetical protein
MILLSGVAITANSLADSVISSETLKVPNTSTTVNNGAIVNVSYLLETRQERL